MAVDAKAAESEEAQSGKRSEDGSISSGKRSEEGGTGSGPGPRRRKQSEADITPRLIRSKPSSGRLRFAYFSIHTLYPGVYQYFLVFLLNLLQYRIILTVAQSSTDSITDSSTQKSIREIQYHDLRYLRYQVRHINIIFFWFRSMLILYIYIKNCINI